MLAIITGIRGQGGSYLAEKFISEGHNVIGISRRSANPYNGNIASLLKNHKFKLVEADITDFASVSGIIEKYKPEYFMNMAAQSHVGSSFNQPLETTDVNYTGVLNILEAIRRHSPKTKFWNASTSERYGDYGGLANETTHPQPVSPYAVAKVAAENIIDCYRKAYGIWATYSIMFNYESPRRSKAFVTRKVTSWAAEAFKTCEKFAFEELESDLDSSNFINASDMLSKLIDSGDISPLRLGNLEAKRSWTHCKDIVDGVYMQMQLADPEVFVFGKNEPRTVKNLVEVTLNQVFGSSEHINKCVVVDPEFYRPCDVNFLAGDTSKAKDVLGWEPKITFEELIKEMAYADIG